MKKNTPVSYVSNKKFYEEMVKYKELLNQASRDGLPRPPIPDYIGLCFLTIAQRLSNKACFIGYSYKDEMISDGIESCVKYVHLFNPEKSNNPFAYFTQAIKMSFIRRIKSEKKQQYLKYKTTQDFYLTEQLTNNTFIPNDNEVIDSFVQEYEENIEKKKNAPKGLEKAIE